MIAVEVKLDRTQVASLEKKMVDILPKNLEDSTFEYAKYLAEKLKIGAITDDSRPITAERAMAASRIAAKRFNRSRSGITMSRGLIYLDSMKPHFVSLKRGRNIVNWTKNNYGTATVSGRSRVYRTDRGGVKGFLYVTPHPFVQRTLNKERNRLPNIVRRGITKTFKATAT